MQIIPIQAVSSQAFSVLLAEQSCQINVRQSLYGLFLDLYVSDAVVIAGALCLDRTRLVRSAYLGFIGDLMFLDTQGRDDPAYGGLGSRFQLAYLETAELK